MKERLADYSKKSYKSSPDRIQTQDSTRNLNGLQTPSGMPKNSMFMQKLSLALLHQLDPETAHNLAVKALRLGLAPHNQPDKEPLLATTFHGRMLANPFGLAPGFDKHAEAMPGLARMGFGFVELGGVTPEPQAGNPRPRVFRNAASGAVINRYGLNSVGLPIFTKRLAAWRTKNKTLFLGVNLGKNKQSQDDVADYVKGATALAAYADYLCLNVSSPNTPGLRALQNKEALQSIITAVQKILQAEKETSGRAPLLFVKIAPDITDAQKQDLADLAIATKIDAIVVGNTTITRPTGLSPSFAEEAGGLSGKPLMALSTSVLRDMYRATKGKVPLIGAGGITTAADAYAKIRAGATLLQLYTALIYQGPALIPALQKGLADLLRRDGFSSLTSAIGTDCP
jgi:dihydroorotate dehydrogenase